MLKIELELMFFWKMKSLYFGRKKIKLNCKNTIEL